MTTTLVTNDAATSRPSGADETHLLDRQAADVLGDRICGYAARRAQDDCQLLIAIGDFDAGHGWSWTDGIKTCAHWLAHTCGMTPGTAREHLRVARALRQMPTTTATFAAGELSYSKVRELTRLAGLVNEAELCEFARYTTASQLARLISSYRAASGTRITAEQRRQFRLITRTGDPMTGITGKLPADQAAVVAAALQTARDLNSVPPPRPADISDDPDATPVYTDADALLDICQHYLTSATTDDDSGEDRHLVIIEVAAEQLTVSENVPAGTPTTAESTDDTEGESAFGSAENVPAGTLRSQVCTIRGTGPIEPQTAQRLTCTGSICGAIIDQHGDIRALGRTRRLVSKRQRRALMIRDQTCQYPGCWQTRHLEAHHVVSWIDGGATDLDNLILLCRFHHVTVHEGGLHITRQQDTEYRGAHTGQTGWHFAMPDGHPIATTGWKMMTADHLARELADHRRPSSDEYARSNDLKLDSSDPSGVRTIGGGEGFSLHNCVQAVFNMTLSQDQQAA